MWLQEDAQALPEQILAEPRRILAALEGDSATAPGFLHEHRERSQPFVAAPSPPCS
jgi:hypothetical protein